MPYGTPTHVCKQIVYRCECYNRSTGGPGQYCYRWFWHFLHQIVSNATTSRKHSQISDFFKKFDEYFSSVLEHFKQKQFINQFINIIISLIIIKAILNIIDTMTS